MRGLALGLILVAWLGFSPAYSFNSSIVEQNQNSFIQLPVYYPLDSIAKSLNHYFQVENRGVICEDDSFTNNNNDNFKVICRQLSDFKVSSQGGRVITEVKVKIEAEFRMDYHIRLDFWLFEINRVITIERPLNFDIDVKFTTRLRMGEDLIPDSETEWDYQWLSQPYISFGPISFRVLKEVAPKVSDVIANYAKEKIDKTITDRADLNTIFYDVLNAFEDPVPLSEENQLWNYFKIMEVISGGLQIDEKKLTFPFEIYFKNYTGFGTNYLDNNPEILLRELPAGFSLLNMDLTNNRFYMQMPIKLTITDMERIVLEQISKRDLTFGSGNLRARLTEVYFSIDRSLVTADVYLSSFSSSSPLGNLVLRITFNPFYDRVFKKLRARYLSYQVLRSDSLVVDFVNYLQRDDFSRILQDAFVLEFDSFVENTHNQINEKMGNYQFNDQLRFKTKVKTLEIKNIFIRGKELYVIVDLQGEIELFLSNLF